MNKAILAYAAPIALMAAVALAAYGLVRSVSLQPEVRKDFFFAETDPAMEQSTQLARRFGAAAQIVISAVSDSIESDRYLERIDALTEDLLRQPGVVSVKSLSNGPGSLEEARESPLWRPLLVADDGRATHVLVVLQRERIAPAIHSVEEVVERHRSNTLTLHIAGAPYVTEVLKRQLAEDFRQTSLTALAVLLAVVALLFRSLFVVLGALTASVAAVVATLAIQSSLGVPLGVLSVNLTTIVVVLVISHVVFLTGNFRRYAESGSSVAVIRKAWLRTLQASFWCMVTTLLSFAGLIFVEAEPLRQLGFGGTIGSLCALLAAYLVFPLFLLAVGPAGGRRAEVETKSGGAGFWQRPMLPVALALVLASLALASMVPRLNFDPDLFTYFPDDGPIEAGLRYLDRNGGSSPLSLSVRHQRNIRLDNKDAYEELLGLHQALRDDPAVGNVISLPLIMAEADSHPLSFLFSYKRLLNFLQSPKYGRIADSFITADRRSAFFGLGMIESERQGGSRLAIVDRLRSIVRDNGFKVELVGGVYFLQGKLAELVSASLWQGLVGMLAAIAVIGFVIGRSARVCLAVVLTTAAVPAAILGSLALADVPLDMIAAPAAIVALGMAVDMIIHLILAARLSPHAGWKAWVHARAQQSRSIAGAAVVVSAAFAVLALSHFPPMARFGLAVLIGTVAAAVLALWLLPVLAAYRRN